MSIKEFIEYLVYPDPKQPFAIFLNMEDYKSGIFDWCWLRDIENDDRIVKRFDYSVESDHWILIL